MRGVVVSRTNETDLYLGINLAIDHVQGGMGDGLQLSFTELRQPVTDADSKEEVLRAIEAIVNEARSIAEDTAGQVHSCGIAVPALVNTAAGLMQLETEGFPVWDGFNLGNWFRERFGLPAIVETEVRAWAAAEMALGQGRGTSDAIFLKIDTSVKAAILSEGRWIRGHSGFAGNVGHIATGNSKVICSCGHYGCLAASVSSDAVLGQFYEALDEVEEEWPEENLPQSAIDVIKLSLAGQAIAQEVLDNFVFDLGAGIASLVNLLNPQRVIVAGEMLLQNPKLLDQAFADAEKRMLPACRTGLRLVRATVVENAECWGAMILAKEALH